MLCVEYLDAIESGDRRTQASLEQYAEGFADLEEAIDPSPRDHATARDAPGHL